MTKFCSLLLCLVVFTFSTAQPNLSTQEGTVKSIGLPFMTSYGPADYQFSNQNFSVIIGNDQRIYFGNDHGILVFDGNNWTRLILPKAGAVYSLAKGIDGTIYVGAVNDMGYLKSSKNGMLEFVSLHEKSGMGSSESYISRVISVGKHVSFSTRSKMMIFDPENKEFDILEVPGNGYALHIKDESMYTYAQDSLYKLENKKWKGIRRTTIKDNSEVGDMLLVCLKDRAIVINANGFFDFDTEQEIEIHEGTKAFLKSEPSFRNGYVLNEKYIILSTWKGLLITDMSGNPIQFLDKSKGIPDDFIFASDLDDSGCLWVASNNGIVKIDLFSPYSILDERMGIDEIVSDIELYQGNLYISTPTGVYKGNWQNLQYQVFSPPDFEKITSGIASGFLTTDSSIFILMEKFSNKELRDTRLSEIEGTSDQIFWSGFKYHDSEDLVFGSLKGKVLHLSREAGEWKIKKEFDPSFLSAKYIYEGSGNEIWVSNLSEGVFRLTYDRETSKLMTDKKYGRVDGLPSDQGNHLHTIFSRPSFITPEGIYSYDSINDRFRPDARFSSVIGKTAISLVASDIDSNVYYFSDELNVLWKTNDGYVKSILPKIDFLKYTPISMTTIDQENIVIGSLNSFIHVDPSRVYATNDFQVNVSSISSLYSDSIYFGGFGLNDDVKLEFPFKENAIRITFSSTFYQGEKHSFYRWHLKGDDDKWSPWTQETFKDYTNLDPGAYTFEVMTRNALGKESKPTSINFIIATPWYRSIFAYLIYLVAVILAIGLIIKLNTRRLLAEKKHLESIVADRTQVISSQKAKVEEQHKKLLEADDLKRRFFVNISHELRTPLTLSMGTVSQALNGAYGTLTEKLSNNLSVTKRNHERLIKMVTSILDISKLEGGRIKLKAFETDPAITVRKVLAFFSSRFEDKNIELKEDLGVGLKCYWDEDKVETIMINLISNAFKFTPEGGRVQVILSEDGDNIIIEVKDSGNGINETDPSIVFDRFYQSPTLKSGEGIGVGLALVRELVQLHHGESSARNDNGAVFTIKFLKGSQHLSPNEIVAEPISSSSLEDKYPLYEPGIKLPHDEDHVSSSLEHILLVEDNPEMRQFVSSILSSSYNVSTVEDGERALEFLQEEVPDLIITDYLMPNMDGYELAVELKNSDRYSKLPIIFLTARAREQDKINVLNLGVDDYLFKPFSQEELLVRIKNLLFTRKQREEYISEESINPEDIEWKDFPSKLKTRVDQYIEAHIKEAITTEQLADSVNQSERSLYRKVKVNTGLSVMGYVKEYRLRTARTLLEEQSTLQTVSEVSYAVGFNYLSHFTKSFKERFGKQPSEYLV
ncbi:MAG: response regulator [Cyclobacteriaceae bacterium]